MPLSPEELARRRGVNVATHYADKRNRARTPIEHATARWEHWRGLIRDLPAETAAPWAEAVTAALDIHIAKLTKLVIPEAKGDRR